ncbi:MAG: NfeD family protein [Lachnospiraceae bacterium]|nr:NfeD family protein [Clostridiales bacterium]MDY3109659.1 NfeD family protein [Lachnospiraceae bacterium]
MNNTVFWLIVLVVLIATEIATMGLTTIWFAAGALVAAIISLLGGNVWWQVGIGLVVSLLLLFFTRPIAVKYFNRERVRTNVESLVGRQAIVISEVNNLQGTGQVNISGQEWSARASSDSVTYPVGSVVNVVAISGVKLIVEERKEV